MTDSYKCSEKKDAENYGNEEKGTFKTLTPLLK